MTSAASKRCDDVNVLVCAHRQDAPHHEKVRDLLEAARRGPEPLGLPAVVSSGFLRVVTHPRIFKEPTPLQTCRLPRGAPFVTRHGRGRARRAPLEDLR